MPRMQSRLFAGDTLSFTTAVAGYSAADGWTLHFRLVPRTSGSAIQIDCAQDTDDTELHLAQVSATTTAGWTAGTYNWFSWVTKASESYWVDSGTVPIVADPRSASAPYDLRSDAQIALDNVRAVIRGKASADVLRYSVGGRSLEHYPMAELLSLESRLAAEVSRENEAARMAAGLASKRRVMVRLGRG